MAEDMDIDSQYPNPGTPPSLQDIFEEVKDNLLPEKSKDLYLKSYNAFVKWQNDHGTCSFSKRVVLSYFVYLEKNRAPSTLWSEYSKLKSTLKLKHGLDIADYAELTSFLKQKMKGYTPKKSAVLTARQVQYFLINASDSEYLAVKVCKGLVILFFLLSFLLTIFIFNDAKKKLVPIKIPNRKKLISCHITLLFHRHFISRIEFYEEFFF